MWLDASFDKNLNASCGILLVKSNIQGIDKGLIENIYYKATTNYFNPPGHTTPAPSVHGSDDEDSVDEETELKELGIK